MGAQHFWTAFFFFFKTHSDELLPNGHEKLGFKSVFRNQTREANTSWVHWRLLSTFENWTTYLDTLVNIHKATANAVYEAIRHLLYFPVLLSFCYSPSYIGWAGATQIWRAIAFAITTSLTSTASTWRTRMHCPPGRAKRNKDNHIWDRDSLPGCGRMLKVQAALYSGTANLVWARLENSDGKF